MGVVGCMVSESESLSCVFLNDVLCSFRKDGRSGVIQRCLKCPHYRRFEREMDEEDERVMNGIDEERKNSESDSRGGLK